MNIESLSQKGMEQVDAVKRTPEELAAYEDLKRVLDRLPPDKQREALEIMKKDLESKGL